MDADEGKAIKVRVSFADDAGNDETLTSAATAAVEAKPNSPATGAPTISGTVRVGHVLTADTTGIEDADGMDNAQFDYQWMSNDGTIDSNIAGATGSTYTLVAADEGKTIEVKVSFTDDADHDETLTSAATDTVASRANQPATGTLAISGTVRVGETLTASTSGIEDADGLDNVAYSYQWLADDTDIAGAASVSYTLTDSEQGKAIKVRVSFTDDAGNGEALTSAATVTVTAASGPLAGFTLLDASDQAVLSSLEDGDEVSLDDPSAGTYAIRADTEPGETIGSVKLELTGAKTVTQTEGLVPYSLYGDDGASALHGEALPVGSYTLRATAYSEAGGTGDTLGVLEVSFTVAASNTPATGLPTISGTIQAGETLTADTTGIADEDGLTNVSYTYQWLANDADIAGETNSTYDLTDADVGRTIKVRVSFTDDANNRETLTSEATAAVAARPNTPATGAPTIGGTVQVSQTLMADTSDIADADGLDNVAYTYQWLADDTDIAGATDASYTLTDSEQGKAIKVRVSFADDAGNEESLTSAATATVAPAPPQNNAATGAPTISGTVKVGHVLTVDTAGIADQDGLDNAQFAYRWLADGTAIAGATGSAYLLKAGDKDKTITVAVSFTDDQSNDESLTSAATATVTTDPLTVGLENEPSNHDGQADFTFDLRFSEEFELSYLTLKDDAFTVTGGSVRKARRLDRDSITRNVLWQITVRPSGGDEVVITLPVTTDCTARGAICTGDDRMLSTRLHFTVNGP